MGPVEEVDGAGAAELFASGVGEYLVVDVNLFLLAICSSKKILKRSLEDDEWNESGKGKKTHLWHRLEIPVILLIPIHSRIQTRRQYIGIIRMIVSRLQDQDRNLRICSKS